MPLKFKRKDNLMRFTGLAIAAVLAGCSATVSTSPAPAPAHQFSAAKSAASLCASEAPNWEAVENAFLANGFVETKKTRLQTGRNEIFLEDEDSDVLVLIGSKGKEGACIVGLPGMTPQQSYELALPWVRKYGAVSNADRGQGLSKKAVQAWAAFDDSRNVYIAAYKEWREVLNVPGASARLLMTTK